MTPRDRVLAAINHASPDRTPRDFWAEPPTWNRLLAHVGHNDRDLLLDNLEIDIRHLDTRGPAEKPIGERVFENFWGERYIYQQTPWGPMREDVPGALSDAQTFDQIKNFHWPGIDQVSHDHLAADCARYENYALLYGFADIWQRPALVRGWETFFLDMVERPDWAHFLSRTFTDFYKADYTRAAEATRGRIDIFLLISDLGTQGGPLISTTMFDEFAAPYIREMVQCIHGLGAKVMYHSCGCIVSLIPRLIELGIDILDPIQPTGASMSPEHLKQKFGGRLCFHGGMNMQQLLPHGTPQQVREEARRYCEVFAPDGGYILAPAHLFQPDVPPENILAVYG